MNELQELTDATRTWLDLAGEIFGRKFVMPKVSLDLSGCTAGRACYSDWTVKFNPQIFLRHKDDFLNRTVPHEIAHLIAFSLNGNRRPKPHGYEWKNIMRKLGVEASRCHHYNIEGIANRRERPYVYSCGCTEHHLTSNLHNKIMLGNCRSCKLCGKKVNYVRTERQFAA